MKVAVGPRWMGPPSALAEMPTNADYRQIALQLASEHQASDTDSRSQHVGIAWQASDPAVDVAADANGSSLTFRRTKYADHDAVLGQAIFSGTFEWTVSAPNSNANKYAGVAAAWCDTRTYPDATCAWAVYLHDGKLCSGAMAGVVEQSAAWAQYAPVRPIPRGTPVHVILDMEQRTLSFAIGEGEPIVAYANLPLPVHPYICSGDVADRSLVVVSGGVHLASPMRPLATLPSLLCASSDTVAVGGASLALLGQGLPAAERPMSDSVSAPAVAAELQAQPEPPTPTEQTCLSRCRIS